MSSAMGKRHALRNLKVGEVSLCRRGMNPGALIGLHKSAADDLRALENSTFPIENADDLAAALKVLPHVKNERAAEDYVAKRAAELDLTTRLPDELRSRVTERSFVATLIKHLRDLIEGGSDAMKFDVKKLHESLRDRAGKLDETQITVLAGFTDEILAKADGPHVTYLDLIEKTSDGSSDDPKDRKKKPPIEAEAAKTDAELAKEAMTRAERAEKQAEASAKELAELKKAQETREIQARVGKLTGLDDADEVVTKALGLDPEMREFFLKALETECGKRLKAQEALIALDGSASARVTEGSAYGQLQAKAAALRKENSALTQEQAFVKVYEDPANAELKRAYRDERRTRAN